MDYSLEKVSDRHLDAILEIEKSCFSSPWSRSALENQMRSRQCSFIAAVSGEAVLGYAGLMSVVDEGYISNVAVSPQFRRLGVADALIDELIARTRDKLSFMTLEVRESNTAAIELYKKHGFKTVGIRKNYYDRPKEDALLMTLFFEPEENIKCC